jgi:hypothetical protein
LADKTPDGVVVVPAVVDSVVSCEPVDDEAAGDVDEDSEAAVVVLLSLLTVVDGDGEDDDDDDDDDGDGDGDGVVGDEVGVTVGDSDAVEDCEAVLGCVVEVMTVVGVSV